ncbi:MAG: hypothetical protein ABR567_16740 [Myxococcales bacterium]|nr:hypothetical protein [Myxococcales bacterium]
MSRKFPLLFVLCALGCVTEPPEFLPPPFGPKEPTNTRLFFPTGLALHKSGALIVANGNSNHAYDGGTLVVIRKSYLKSVFDRGLSCDAFPTPDKNCDDDVSGHPGTVFGPEGSDGNHGSVIIGNYAGPVALNDDGSRAYTASRDVNTLNAVAIDTDLNLTCAPGAGATTNDCRKGLIDLGASGVLGPFSIARGVVTLPGENPRPALFVSAMIPRIDSIASGTLNTSAVVAALDMADPSRLLYTTLSGSEFVAAVTAGQGTAVGPMLFDPVRHQLVLGGCFQRFQGTGAGEPGTGRCIGIGFNYLRFLDSNAQLAALPELFDLYPDVASVETTGMAFGDFDEKTGAPMSLWVTLRNPDVLAQVELPLLPSVPPRVRRVVPLPVSPAEVARIPRPNKGADLIAVAAEKSGAVAIYDTGVQQVVAQVERLGDSPFTIQVLPPSEDGKSARLAVTVFRSCGIALLEVPYDQPWNATLRGRVGKCQ